MRKTLTILLSILSLSIIAQVPQGVGYQGVATDANGIELVNQAISIRASVLSGSATGTIEWEETHSTSTDTFGLFTLTIGQGTNTTNGIQTNFADISWGTNTHYLKIEMDVTGGTNYSFMGTNQMMSVPYALYAENANINYDSISNFLSGDSTFITNVGGGMGGGGCNLNYPEGLDGEGISEEVWNTNEYTVPAGKRLYITNTYVDASYNLTLVGLGYITYNDEPLYQPIIVNAGEKVATNSGSHARINGLLIDETNDVMGISEIVWNTNEYTVPTGKRLYITNTYVDGGQSLVLVGLGAGQITYVNQHLKQTIIVNAGEKVATSSSSHARINGYLVDENYFAGCGGGGGSSSSTSSLDSTTIANMIAGSGGSGCDPEFPDGFDMLTAITSNFSASSPYTVPSNKRLYIANANTTVYINGLGVSSPTGNHILCNPGDVITHTSSSTYIFSGFLVNCSPAVTAITSNFSASSPYTVPSNKRLYIANANTTVYINGLGVSSPSGNHILCNPGDVITHTSSSTYIFSGYLVDENYFAGCGGGGSSSTSSLDSTTIANMIAAALPTPAAQIGEFRDGGVVFWVDGTGQHGLVCDIQELGLAEWGCEGFYATPNGTTIGSGAQNTIDILAACLTTGIAADLCANSTAQGYSDWFLPSKDALNQMYVNQTNVNFALLFNGGSAFSTTVNYWSSSHYNHDRAWRQNFFDGDQYYTLKSTLLNVRAVRAF